jgi:hypothetical protein
MITESIHIKYPSTLSKRGSIIREFLNHRNTNIAQGFVIEMPPCHLGEIDECTTDGFGASKPLHEYACLISKALKAIE